MDSSCANLGTPFFPLVQSGLDGVGSDLVDTIADLELRGSEDLVILLGGEQPSDPQGFFLRFLADDIRQALGIGFLFGSEDGVSRFEVRHGKLRSYCQGPELPLSKS